MGPRLRIPIGSRTLNASWPLTLLTGAAVFAFVSLGNWQWSKGNARAALAEEFAQGGEAQALGTRDLADVQRFQRVRLTGTLDPERQFLLDNRTHAGRPGYEVLTPLDRGDGSDLILVNRGWIPFSGFRDRLPDVSFATASPVEITGRVDELPARGLESGRAAPARNGQWPKVTSYPTAAELAAALGRPTEARIVLLDADVPNGYVREWQPPGIPAGRHWAYGVQWYGFAALAMLLWVILSLRRSEKSGNAGS